MVNGRWLETDERREAIKALEMTARMLYLAHSDEYYWKWVIIAIHNALQALFVVVVSGSGGFGAIEPKQVGKWLWVYRTGKGKYPGLSLMRFVPLYEKVKKTLRLSMPEEVDKSVKRLNDFRNEFMHFTPKGWSLELDGLPALLRNSLRVVESLISRERPVIWWHDETEAEQFQANYREIEGSLSRLWTGAG